MIVTAFVNARNHSATDYSVLFVVGNDNVVKVDFNFNGSICFQIAIAGEFSAADFNQIRLYHFRFNLVDNAVFVHDMKIKRFDVKTDDIAFFNVVEIAVNKYFVAFFRNRFGSYLEVVAFKYDAGNFSGVEGLFVLFVEYFHVFGTNNNVDGFVAFKSFVHALDFFAEYFNAKVFFHDAGVDVAFAYKVCYESVCRFVVNLFGRCDLLNDAAAHYNYFIAHCESFFLVVGDVHESYPELAVHFHQLDLHFLAHFEVECA